MDEKKSRGYRQENEEDMINLIDNLNQEKDLKFNRRSFLKASVGTSVVLALASLPFSVKALIEEWQEEAHVIKIGNVEDVKVGNSLNFSYPTDKDPAVLVRLGEDRYVAYNNKCTHLQCPVFWEKKEQVLLCPCHAGYFDVNTGHPMAGPPQRELPKIEIVVENGEIFAVGRKIRHEK